MIPWYGYLVLFPLFCALVGWLTNVLAVRLIFYPVVPRRVLGLRIQGVLPKHRERFAREMAEVVTSDFMTTGEMVRRLDADALIEELRPAVRGVVQELLDEVRRLLPPAKRPLLGDHLVEALEKQAEQELRRRLPRLLEGVRGRADHLVDLSDVITDKLLSIATGRFVELVARLGQRELRYIEVYGALFGFLIGLVQFTASSVLPLRLSLILVGVLVGAVTNFLALKMLFFPRQPRRVLLLTVQGLFPKRQEEIATELARVAARDFIVTREVLGLLLRRALPDRLGDQELDWIEEAAYARFPQARPLVASLVPAERRPALRRLLARVYEQRLPELAEALVDAADRQLDIYAILRGKVVSLSKLRFETFTRNLFKEEELSLVVFGAILGGTLGALQLALLVLQHWI